MSYEESVSGVVKVIESIGGAIMVLGGLFAFGRFAQQVLSREPDAYRQLRANLGRVILLGLEVLIIADIIRTIVVDQSLESVGVLGLIVVIRIVLSFSLEVEIDGAWPWNGWRLQRAERAAGSGRSGRPGSGSDDLTRS
jgi:uncharacterized membrane protein